VTVDDPSSAVTLPPQSYAMVVIGVDAASAPLCKP
jgi:hypothetical protein